MSDDNIPVVIGVGRITQRTGSDLDRALDPIQLMAEASRRAAADAVAGGAASSSALLGSLGSVSTVMMLLEDRVPKGVPPFYRNPSLALARQLGAPAKARCAMSYHGGHAAQMLVNELAEKLSVGEIKLGIVAGGECLDTFMKATKAGRVQLPGGAAVRDAVGRQYASDAGAKKFVWGDDPNSPAPEVIGKVMRIASVHEAKHGLAAPATAYAIMDQALRCHLGRSIEDHLHHNAELFAGFSRVAAGAAAEHAWFPRARSAAELETVSPENRAVTMPGYPKYMNSVMDVDQAAAVMLATVGEARRLGVPESQWVYLHGTADAMEEPSSLLSRPEMHRSHALAAVGKELVASSGVAMDKVEIFDIYSCFPVAVEIACRELGLGEKRDGEKLTLTGGLPYHGGPGNAYTLFGVVAMCEQLRKRPGAFGLVTANGGYVTKHSAGIYSTTPYAATHPGQPSWRRRDPEELQRRLQAEAVEVPVATVAEGRCRVESYTVEYGREGPTRAVVVGRLLAGPSAGQRFIATSRETAAMELMAAKDCIGLEGSVATSGDRCTFAPDGVAGKSKL